MESKLVRWDFKNGKVGGAIYRELHKKVSGNVNTNDERGAINLGFGDPTPYPSYQTTPVAEEAIVNALHSSAFNGYPPPYGVPAARRAVAEHLNVDLPPESKLSEDDVYITSAASHGIELVLTILDRPGANILLPRPGFRLYEARAQLTHLELRYFDLLPHRDWEVDLDAVEALADDNTIAMVLINPGYPTGNVFTSHHLQKVAETAARKGIIVISDEVYRHIVFGGEEYTPMGKFGSTAPVLTLGSMSKRWIIPGWRMGWIAASDPHGLLKRSGIIESIQKYMGMTSSPATLIQGAIPEILSSTPIDFFDKINSTMRECAEKCYQLTNEIPCLTTPTKPQGCMFFMIKLNPFLLEGIEDDLDFCSKLAKEEAVILLPGIALGMKNWIQVTFATEAPIVDEAFGRIKAFYKKHAKKQLDLIN